MRTLILSTFMIAVVSTAASASCDMVGGHTANDGVCEVPRSVVSQYSAIEQAKAKIYARQNGIRWRIVNR